MRKQTPYERKIKKRLIDLGMRQADLADAVGISRQYLHKIMVGERSGAKYLSEIHRILYSDAEDERRSQ